MSYIFIILIVTTATASSSTTIEKTPKKKTYHIVLRINLAYVCLSVCLSLKCHPHIRTRRKNPFFVPPFTMCVHTFVSVSHLFTSNTEDALNVRCCCCCFLMNIFCDCLGSSQNIMNTNRFACYSFLPRPFRRCRHPPPSCRHTKWRTGKLWHEHMIIKPNHTQIDAKTSIHTYSHISQAFCLRHTTGGFCGI